MALQFSSSPKHTLSCTLIIFNKCTQVIINNKLHEQVHDFETMINLCLQINSGVCFVVRTKLKTLAAHKLIYVFKAAAFIENCCSYIPTPTI